MRLPSPLARSLARSIPTVSLSAGPGAPQSLPSPGLPWAALRPSSRAALGPWFCPHARRVSPGTRRRSVGGARVGPPAVTVVGAPGCPRPGPARPPRAPRVGPGLPSNRPLATACRPSARPLSNRPAPGLLIRWPAPAGRRIPIGCVTAAGRDWLRRRGRGGRWRGRGRAGAAGRGSGGEERPRWRRRSAGLIGRVVRRDTAAGRRSGEGGGGRGRRRRRRGTPC